MATHEVTNQPPPLVGHDVAATDVALLEGVGREGAGWSLPDLHRLGVLAGSAEAQRWARQANDHPPVLHTHDRYGHRIDEVEYHPAYHSLMEVAVRYGLHAAPWADGRPGAHVARAAKFFVWSQVEAGHGCPISMTYSIVPALRADPEQSACWEPVLTSGDYDPRYAPAATKRGAIAGMAMTEKQGGSDVRANTSWAVHDGNESYRLTGHKWFCSAPGSDLFLMLAYAGGGITCFAVPRYQPDGTRNAVHIQRLKDKLGNRSNASGEIEFDGAWAKRVGEEGRGVATIITMVNHTRLDCVIGSAAGMRAALAQALHHTAHRHAFGRRLAEQPLMREVLADLAVESEAATTVMLRLARSYDAAADGASDTDVHFRRLATAIAKYWVCKRQPVVVAEALECLGGAGYVEDSGMPRLFRESPLNGIWEGSGNVIALDVLRALRREPEATEAVRAEIALAAGADRRLDRAIADLDAELAAGTEGADAERRARRIVERFALALQGSLLVRHAPAPVADAFCASRLAGDWGRTLGTLPPGTDVDAVVDRAWPG